MKKKILSILVVGCVVSSLVGCGMQEGTATVEMTEAEESVAAVNVEADAEIVEEVAEEVTEEVVEAEDEVVSEETVADSEVIEEVTEELVEEKAEEVKEEAKPVAETKKVEIPDWFDASFYASQYPDVVNALGNSAEALYNHYNTCGKKEGRMANANDTSAKAEAAQTAQADTSSADSGNNSASNTSGYEKETWYDMGWYYFIICDHIPFTEEEMAYDSAKSIELHDRCGGWLRSADFQNSKWGNVYVTYCSEDSVNVPTFPWS